MRLLIKNTLLAAVAMFLTSQAIAEDKRWTLEEAVKSHQQNVGERASRGIDHNKGLADWNSINRVPPPLTSGSNNREKYVELFSGECRLGNTCSLSDNINNYATVVVGANNQHGRLNTAVFPTAGLIGKELNMSTNTSGDGNDLIHLKFETATSVKYVGAKYTGIITNIWAMHKQPPVAAVCSAGQTQSTYTTNCPANTRLCEEGENRRTCTAGQWDVWQVIRNPICRSYTQNCP